MKERQKLVAIMFSDIKGYSKLISSKQTIIYKFNREIENLAKAHPHFIYFKKMGDGLLIVMDSILELTKFALMIKNKIVNRNWIEKGFNENLKIRIALHLGDVTLGYSDDNITIDDIIGNMVDYTARIEPIVKLNRVFCSESVYLSIKDRIEEFNIKFVGKKSLDKNYMDNKEIDLYDISFKDLNLTIYVNGEECKYENSRLEIGRSDNNRINGNIIKLKDTTVSEKHCYIEKNSFNEFIIVDENSTNGVFVNDEKVDKKILQDGDKIILGRTELKVKIRS